MAEKQRKRSAGRTTVRSEGVYPCTQHQLSPRKSNPSRLCEECVKNLKHPKSKLMPCWKPFMLTRLSTTSAADFSSGFLLKQLSIRGDSASHSIVVVVWTIVNIKKESTLYLRAFYDDGDHCYCTLLLPQLNLEPVLSLALKSLRLARGRDPINHDDPLTS